MSSIAPEAPAKVLLKRKTKTITVFTNNTCLMPEGLSRVNNLPFTTDRATLIGKKSNIKFNHNFLLNCR